MGIGVVSLPGKELHQFRVDEELFATGSRFGQHADLDQVLEMARGGLPGGDAEVEWEKDNR